MIFLFIHQNFPSQYLHIVRRLAQEPENEVYFITQESYNEISGVRKLIYSTPPQALSNCHAYTVPFDTAVRTGMAVRHALEIVKESGVIPDLIVGHCGWGETLFVKDVFPDVPLLTYFEFFYHAEGADVGFDPEFTPPTADDRSRLKVRNAVSYLSFAETDWGHTATRWQRSLFPTSMQSRIAVLHEGVNTERVRPDEGAWLTLGRDKIRLSREDQVITYVARNLEPYRGFHIFMRCLPELQRRFPSAHVLIVGGDGLSYSDPPPYGSTWREMMLAELGDCLKPERVHFLGQVPHDTYLNVLQISTAHIHLTYPFVLSWSFLEAMAAGCLVIGSATPPVLEVLCDRRNGLTVDFFSPEEICDRVEEVISHPDQMQAVRDAARATVIANYDLHTVTLPQWEKLLHNLVERRFPSGLLPASGPVVDMSYQ